MKIKVKYTLRIITVLILLSFNNSIFSLTYNRPIPEVLNLKDIAFLKDVFSVSLAIQIHSTLFKMDQFNIPRQNLIDNFTVSNDGLNYYFTLKKMTFHDNSILDSKTVLSNFLFYLENKIENHEQLFSIEGAMDFYNKKSPSINGFILDPLNNLKFQIKLRYQDINFISKLTDQRLSILKSNRDPKIGLGDFKVDKIIDNKVFLSRFIKGKNPNIPDKAIYYFKIEKSEAIRGFINREFDDLFFYNLDEKEIILVKNIAKYKELYSTRVYVIALNAKNNFKNKDDRINFLASLNLEKLRDKCYPGNTRAFSIIPKGLPGFKNEVDKSNELLFNYIYKNKKINITEKRNSSYKIDIVMNIGSENCLKEYFNELKSEINLKVNISPILKTFKRWENNKVDAIIIWFEGETNLNFWGHFNPNTELTFGDPKDLLFAEIYNKLDKSTNMVEKEKSARYLDNHILSLATVFPLFHPKVFGIYSNKFINLQPGLHYAYSIPLISFTMNNEEIIQ